MKPPNIGAKLVARFNNSADEPLTWRRHQGYQLTDGTMRDLGYLDEEAQGPYYFGPVPSNMARELRLEGHQLTDARLWWTRHPATIGTKGDPPTARKADRVVRQSTGVVYEVRGQLDVASSQSGLTGVWLLPVT